MKNKPVIALVATPKFKDKNKDKLRQFAYEHLHTLTSHFEVVSTGRTHADISGFIELDYLDLDSSDRELIGKDLGLSGAVDQARWRGWHDSIINSKSFVKKRVGVEGMIEIATELVQGRLDAVIQFSMEDDTTVRAGSAVLRREANVHDVPIASDVATAHAFVRFWKAELKADKSASLFRSRTPKEALFVGMEENPGNHVLALIAHNGRKDEMCRFIVRHSKALRCFRHILATGHSGESAREYLGAAGWTDQELEKIITFNSGPEGGDVEIAMAVIRGLCHNVMFFQDPATSHPHEADIRLFEQAILAGTKVRLASNAQSARILLEAICGSAPLY